MKNKVIIALLSVCLVAGSVVYAADTKEKEAIQVSNEEEADEKKAPKEEEKDKADEKAVEETEKEESPVRLVSVDDLEKYIELGEYKGISYVNEEVIVTDMMVSEKIMEERKNTAETITDQKTPVASGDIVDIAYVGRKDGEAFDGGTSDSYFLEIGSGTFIPGFEDGIIGMKVGETKDIPLTFPEQYPAENLAGADVVFEVTVNGIQRVPELTDEWVAANTDYKTVDEYKEAVLMRIKEQMEAERDENLRYTLFETVFDNSVVKEYPEEDLVEREKAFGEYVEATVVAQGMDFEEYMASDENQQLYEQQSKEYGEFSLKLAMVIQAILDKEGIDFAGAEADMMKVQLAQSIGATSFDQIVDFYGDFEAYVMLGQELASDIILKNADITSEEAEEEEETADEDLSEGEEEAEESEEE